MHQQTHRLCSCVWVGVSRYVCDWIDYWFVGSDCDHSYRLGDFRKVVKACTHQAKAFRIHNADTAISTSELFVAAEKLDTQMHEGRHTLSVFIKMVTC